MAKDTDHLDALNVRLSHERARLAEAKTDQEREIRAVWISQIEKEIVVERRFLGMTEDEPKLDSVSDDDLLSQLLG